MGHFLCWYKEPWARFFLSNLTAVNFWQFFKQQGKIVLKLIAVFIKLLSCCRQFDVNFDCFKQHLVVFSTLLFYSLSG